MPFLRYDCHCTALQLTNQKTLTPEQWAKEQAK